MGCSGHSIVQTPNLDRLAASGTRFTNCWTPSPICVSARAALATGRWAHEIEAWDSSHAYTGEPHGWAHEMRNRGRDVVSFGKLHHRSGADDDGFTERVLPMFIVGGVGWVQGLSRRQPIPYDESAELAADVGVGETTYTRYDRRVTAAACNWLTAPERSDQPWVAFVSLVAPHYPLAAPEEFAALYPHGEVPPPEIGPVVPANPAVQALTKFWNYGDYFDDATTIAGRAAYFGLCSFLDDNVGKVLSALDDSGQSEDTLVIYSSDHGEFLGNRGLWGKSFMYEDSAAVPMIVSGPGVPPGATVDTNVNLIDIAPTVLGGAAAAVGNGHARSLVELANLPTHERLAFTEYHDGGSITGSFAIRHGEWKYVHHEGFEPELFDVENDPDELNDVAADVRLIEVRRRCAKLLADVVDTKAANDAAFAAQEAMIAELGGRDALINGFRFNHTPAPG